LENLAKTFMSEYNVYGMAFSNQLLWLFRTAPMWDSYVGNPVDSSYFWYPDSTGRIKPGIAHPEFKVALENWARWYKEGIISPDFVNMNDERAHEEVVNGRVGIQCFWQWWGWWPGPNVVGMNGPEATFIPINLPHASGNRPANGQIFFPNSAMVVVNANAPNPAAYMKVLSMSDHMVFSPDANLSDDELAYYMYDGREHCMTPTFYILDPSADLLQYKHVLHALETGDTSDLFTTGMKFKYADSLNWIDEYAVGGLGAYMQMGWAGSAYARSQYLFDNGHIKQTSMWGAPPEEFLEVGTVGDIIAEGVMHIIMGVEPLSYYDTVLANWYSQGGQIMEDAVNLYHGN
jgi:putative aldouronate transport system substrate-binding protein